MSGIIKAGQGEAHSRIFAHATARTASAALAPADPADSFEQRIGDLEAELLALQQSVAGLVEEAREEGRKEGRQERDDSASKKLELLKEGLAEASVDWAQRLEAMNSLSVHVSKTVLQKMIGNPDWHGDFLAQAIAARFERLDASSVIAVRLSPADISSDEIAELSARGKMLVEVSDELDAGECTILLRMGEIQLGPREQWKRAAALLDELAGEPC